MRICGHCNQPPRWDENLSSAFFEGFGGCAACDACRAKAQGVPAPEPPRYPPGCRMPRKPGSDADIPICGLCRVALSEGQDKGTPCRIRPEMLLAGEEVEPGGYAMCAACLTRWRPRVAAYLKRLCRSCNELDCQTADHVRALPTHATERQVQGNLLL